MGSFFGSMGVGCDEPREDDFVVRMDFRMDFRIRLSSTIFDTRSTKKVLKVIEACYSNTSLE